MSGKCKPYLIAGLLILWCAVAVAQDFNMFSAIKSGGSFVQFDLEGDWSMQALSVEGDDVRWLSADLAIGPAGNVTTVGLGGDSGGQGFSINFGKLVLNASGSITGTFRIEDTGATDFVVQNGNMDATLDGNTQLNNYAIFIASCRDCSPDQSLLVYLTRSGFSGFQQAEAGGFWRLFAIGFENGSNRLFWLFGAFQIDSSGNVVDQSFQVERSNGQQGFFATGRVLVEPNGSVNGFFEAAGANATTTDFSGQMTTDLNQITLVSAGSQNEKLLAVLIYSGDNQNTGIFADTDIDGSWRYYGIRFDQPAADADIGWEFGGLDIENRGTVTGDGFTERGGGSGNITGAQIEVNVQGNLVNGSLQLNGISRTINSGQMNIPPFPQTANPETRFTFVGTDSTGANGGGGSNVLPRLDTGDSCLISSVAKTRLVDHFLRLLLGR